LDLVNSLAATSTRNTAKPNRPTFPYPILSLQRPKAKGGGVYRAELFTHDAKADQMICYENKRLPFRYFDRQPGRTIRVYTARKEECHVCPSRQACCGQSKLK